MADPTDGPAERDGDDPATGGYPAADEVEYPDAVEPGDPDSVTEGDIFTYTRSFTDEEVESFVELSRDENPQHVRPDEDGRLVVHGLLVGTLPTKIGGDLEYVARELNYHTTARVPPFTAGVNRVRSGDHSTAICPSESPLPRPRCFTSTTLSLDLPHSRTVNSVGGEAIQHVGGAAAFSG